MAVIFEMQEQYPNGSTTFIDDSPNAYTLTAKGSAQHSSAAAKFGSTSMLFSNANSGVTNSSDAVVGPASGAVTVQMRPSGFTMDFWINLNSTIASKSQMIVSDYSSSSTYRNFYVYMINLGGNDIIRVGMRNPFAVVLTRDMNLGTTLSTGTWYYLSFEWDLNTFRSYVDGTPQGTAVLAAANWAINTGNPNGFNVSGYQWGANQFYDPINGYLGGLRIDDTQLYGGSSFTPPTTLWQGGADYTADLAAGSFALSGGAATMNKVYLLELSSGAFVVSGGAQGYGSVYRAMLEAGQITLTGGDASPTWGGPVYTQINPRQQVVNTPNPHWIDEGELAVHILSGKMMTVSNAFEVVEIGGLYNAKELPRTDPHVAGQFWNDDGTLKVSAG